MPTLSTLLSLNTLGLACAAPLAMPDGQGNPLPVTASPAVPVRPGRGFFRKETEK